MSDRLDRVDRELAALGTVPEQLNELLNRYGLRNRSIENVDEELLELREGHSERPPSQTVVDRPSFLPLGWDQPESEDEAAAVPAPVQLRDEITVTSPAPEPDSAQLSASEAIAAFAKSEPGLPSPVVTGPAPEPRASFAPPVADPPMPEPLPEPAAMSGAETFGSPAAARRPSRPDLQALLDEALDPNEFPSSRPPPMGRNSSLPAPMQSPPPVLPQIPRSSRPPVEPEADSDFELLVDDEDIIEIDE